MPNLIPETRIEQALLQKLRRVHGYDVLDCCTEEREELADGFGRVNKREVILFERLRAAVALNPETYDRALFKTKGNEVIGLIVNQASQGLKWAA